MSPFFLDIFFSVLYNQFTQGGNKMAKNDYSVFQDIHSYIEQIDVFQRYVGGKITHYGKNSWAVCPFHNDSKPSLVLYKNGFKCYVCNAHGDTLDFVGQLFGIRTPLDVVRKLNQDFSIGLEINGFNPTSEKNIDYLIKRNEYEKFCKWEKNTYYSMCDELHCISYKMQNEILTEDEFSAYTLRKAELDTWTDILIYSDSFTFKDYKNSKQYQLKQYLKERGALMENYIYYIISKLH